MDNNYYNRSKGLKTILLSCETFCVLVACLPLMSNQSGGIETVDYSDRVRLTFAHKAVEGSAVAGTTNRCRPELCVVMFAFSFFAGRSCVSEWW